ncbi:MAG: peptidoglycan-binding domain-containing protein [Bacteroidota bacterium]
MKQIIIFLLLVIIGIMGYNFYRNWQRFHPPNYQYEIPDTIKNSSSESKLLYDYFHAVEALDSYVITQWGDEGIDVRNPGDDGVEELAAVAEYAKKRAKVRFYENQLLNPSPKVKPKEEPSEQEVKEQLIQKMFYSNPSGNRLRLGEQSALVFEIQRLLIRHGDSIRHDGLFRTETYNSLRAFEEKNGLLPDGRLDAITLEYLLK